MGTDRQAYLGQILVKNLLAKPEDIQRALEIQAEEQQSGKTARPLGRIMVDLGLLTPDQLERVLEEQRRRAGMNRLGAYEIVSRLGEGGMGAVYKGRETESGRFVAIKVLNRRYADNAGFLTRFKRESTVGRELDHPHIVRTLGFGEDRGNHFIALELMEGDDLSRKLKAKKVFPEREALEIVRPVAAALQYAHERGLVHRDVKPSNIMFAADGTVKLSDFGLVKSTDPEASHLTVTGVALGTPHYIAPEQALGGHDLDVRADLYALGATLYHLVTGRTPFAGATPLEVIQKHLSEKLTPPDELNPEVGDGCVALIEKLMAKSRDDRYATPAALLADVDRVVNGQEPAGAEIDEARSTLKVSARRQEAIRRRSPRPSPTRRVTVRRGVRLNPASPLVWGSGAAAAAVILGLIFLWPGEKDAPEPRTAAVPRTAPPPVKPSPRPPATAPAPAPVRVTEPSGTPLSLEEEAQAALATLMRFEGLRFDDRAGRIARLEEFISKYGETFAAARARSLLNTLKNPVEPVPPKPAPKPASPGPVADPKPLPPPAAAPLKKLIPRVNDPERWKNAVDLFAFMDPQRDRVKGLWAVKEGEGLVSADGVHNVLDLPYLPPDEYDFRVVFTPVAGTPNVNQILTYSDCAFAWLLGGYGNTTFGFDTWDGMSGDDHPSAIKKARCLENGRRYEAIVQVRHTGVTTYLDGTPVLSLKTDYTNLKIPSFHSVRNESHLGLVAYECMVVFHAAELLELSAPGAPDFPPDAPPAPGAPPPPGTELNVGDTDPQGWVCLFNGRDLDGWHLQGGDADVRNGVLILKDQGEITTDIPQRNFEVRGQVRPVRNGRDHCGGIGFRRPGRLREGPNLVWCNDGDVHYWNRALRSKTPVAKAGVGKVALGTWQPFRLRVINKAFVLEVGGKAVLRGPVQERSPSTIAFYDHEGGLGSYVEFKDLWGRELGADGEPGLIPPDAIVLFGPGGPSAGVHWRAGRTSLRRRRGERAYIDGARGVTFETGGGQLGMTGDACFHLGYTAERDCEVIVVLRIQKLGRIARAVQLPAGRSMRIDLPVDAALLGSGKDGHRILSFGLEPKGIKSGELRVLRLLKTGELAE